MTLSVSVVMATYQAGRFLRPQLESILNQSLPVNEVVVGDDGSTDGTLDVVRELANRFDGGVRILPPAERAGTTKNFQRLLQSAQGDIILLSDQDDVWRPQRVRRTMDVFAADPELDYVFSDADIVDEDGGATGDSLWKSIFFGPDEQRKIGTRQGVDVLLRRNVVTGATMAVRRRALPNVLPIPEGWVHDGWMALVLEAMGRGLAVPEKWIAYRRHGHQQIGTVKGSVSGFLQLGRRQSSAYLLKEAANYLLVREHLMKLGLPPEHSACVSLEQKAAFLRDRAWIKDHRRIIALPTASFRLKRGLYHRFGMGTKQMILDLVTSQPKPRDRR